MSSLDREEPVAANGLLHRRLFLKGGALFTGAAAVGGIVSSIADAAEFPPPWRIKPGRPFVPYGMPSRFEEVVQRLMPVRPPRHPTPGAGATFTTLQPINSYPNRPQ